MFGIKRPEDGRVGLEAVESCIIERDMAHRALLDLIEKNVPYNIVYELAPADGGSHRSIRSVAEVVPIEDEGSHKIVGIIQDITNSRRTEDALRRDRERNEALLELSKLTDLTINDMAEKAMNYGLSLSQSKIGHIAFLNEDGTVLKMNHYSKEVTDNCKIKDRPMGFDLSSTGLWMEALRQGRPVITNDYDCPNHLKKGFPEGHVRLKRHVSIAVFDHNRVVAVAGMGNKETDYTMEDALDLSLLMDGMWQIIKRKEAEEALRTREEEYSKLIYSIPDLVIRTDIDGTIRFVNEQALKVTGYEKDEVIGKSIFKFISGKDADRAISTFREMISERLGPRRYELVLKNGSKASFEANGDVLLKNDGTPFGIVLIGRDIAERDRLEAALEHLNRDLVAVKEVHRSISKAGTEHDLLEDVCRIVCQKAGYSRAWIGIAEMNEKKSIRPAAWSGFDEDLIYKIDATWGEDMHGTGPTGECIRTARTVIVRDWSLDPRTSPWRSMTQGMDFGSCVSIPLTESGKVFGALTMIAPVKNAFTDKEIDLLEEMVCDLSLGVISLRTRVQRDLALKALNRSEMSRKALFEAVPEAAWVIDPETGRFIDANPAALKMYGYTIDDLVRHTAQDISAEPEKTKQAIKEGWSFIPLRYHKRRDGTVFPVEIICNELFIDDRRTIIGTSRDISYRMRAQEAVQEANRKLNLLTSITRHDLNNQLTILTGYLQLVDEKDPKTFGHVDKCRSIADRIRKIVQFTAAYENMSVSKNRSGST